MLRHAVAWLRSFLGLKVPLQRKLLPASGSNVRPYALVTGSTDGIGEALAIELASVYGFNIVLHGRSESKLEVSKQRVIDACTRRKRKVDVQTICADASKARDIDYQAIFVEPLSKVHLSLVINNVGVSGVHGFSEPFKQFKPLQDIPDGEVNALFDVNLSFNMLLAKHLTPLLARSPTRKGLLVSISSGVSVAPVPYLSVYSAVKAALNAFIKALSLEIKLHPTWRNKVEVQSIIVGSVRTNRLSGIKHGLFVPNADEFARALCRVLADGTLQGAGCWAHALQLGALKFTPAFAADRAVMGVGRSGIGGFFDDAVGHNQGNSSS